MSPPEAMIQNIEAAIERYRRHVAEQRIGLLDSEDFAGEYERIKRSLEGRLSEIHIIRHHACEWSEDSRCVVCGADGRA